MRRAAVVVAFVFVAVGLIPRPVAGQPEARTHDVTPADYFTLKTITELAVSPDGQQVAYCLATWDLKADDRKTDLWVVPTDGKGKPRQLTSDRANDRHPKWSADGKAVYVLGNRKKDREKAPPYDGKAQIWKVPLDGGDPEAVTKVEKGVVGFDYAPRADALFYSVDATATDQDDFTKLREKFDKPEYGHGKRTVSEVFRLADGKAEKVIAEKRYVREFAVTADGKRVAMVTAIDDTVIKSEGESRVDVWEQGEPGAAKGEPGASATGGKITTPPTDVYRKNAASPWAWLENLAWNPDGTRFAFCAIFDAYPAEVIIGERNDGKWTTKRMERNGHHILGYGSPLEWRSDMIVGFLTDHHAVVGFGEYDTSTPGEGVRSFNPSEVAYAFGYLPTPAAPALGRKVAVLGRSGGFPELCLVEPDGAGYRPLTDLNPQAKTWKLPTVEHYTWTLPDDRLVGGPLELPYGWKKGDKPLPLVVAIHGGPTTASYNDLRFDPHNGRLYFAAAGYAVLCPNYRGSTGYGDKFVTDLVGNENDLDVKDILAGIQRLIKEGITDPDRIAVMGWSNGGYLTNCLITLKDPPVKIRAASSGAGILDTVAEWGFNDEPAYPRVFKKGLPWETPDIYRKTSPTYGLGNVRTPTLIHVGANDERCPPGHSRMLYRALREYVNVPTELIVYPGEPHGLTKASNRRAKMEWDLAWFEKYVKGK